jgi:MarR family transcriptional regulator, transcriptional regulator for hemolysin
MIGPCHPAPDPAGRPGRLPNPKAAMPMAVNSSAGSTPATGSGKGSFAIYRGGNTTAHIHLTVQMVLAARRWRSLLDERFRPIEQSSARMEALSAIMNSPPLSAQVDIARRLRIEGPTLTRMLDSLEQDGLVQRLPDPGDRRTKRLQLTPEGEEKLEEIFDLADVLRARLLDGFSDDEIDIVNRFLKVLLQRLDDGLPDTR